MKNYLLRKKNGTQLTLSMLLAAMEGITIIFGCYLTLFLKPFRDRWGLSKEETKRSFPGDEFVEEPKSQFTHAIKINASAQQVWPWIAQIGQGRGGFYSYEALEELAGLHIRNADEILPEFQNPQLGDLIPFGQGEAYPLIVCEKDKAMAIGHCRDLDRNEAYDPEVQKSENNFQVSWLWYVEPLDEQHSRFISRNRVTYTSSFKNKLLFGLLAEPVIFAMDRKMCYGIKRRAEATL